MPLAKDAQGALAFYLDWEAKGRQADQQLRDEAAAAWASMQESGALPLSYRQDAAPRDEQAAWRTLMFSVNGGWELPCEDLAAALRRSKYAQKASALEEAVRWEETYRKTLPHGAEAVFSWKSRTLKDRAVSAAELKQKSNLRREAAEAALRVVESLLRTIDADRDEWDSRAEAALRGGKVRTLRDLAKAIDCSVGEAQKLPAWQEFEKKRKKTRAKRAGKAPVAVSLTEGVLANEGRPDEALEALIAEQKRDFEESPLVSRAQSPRVRSNV